VAGSLSPRIELMDIPRRKTVKLTGQDFYPVEQIIISRAEFLEKSL
jgi:hypothetical protein